MKKPNFYSNGTPFSKLVKFDPTRLYRDALTVLKAAATASVFFFPLMVTE